jgi:hypothetical protein
VLSNLTGVGEGDKIQEKIGIPKEYSKEQT